MNSGTVEIRTGYDQIDFDRVHSWLASTYWSPGIERSRVQAAAAGSSLVIGAFEAGEQIGYLRVVSDRTTFAWICDVFVDENHRGKGIARQMVNFAMASPELQGLRRWILATRDAHGVYEACGFHQLDDPERWMAHYPESSIGPV